MSTSRIRTALATAALALLSAQALALPATTVSWVQPSGITNGIDTVDIWVRLTVDAGASEPLVLDGSTTSFSAQDLADFSKADGVWQGGWASCSTSFFPQDECWNKSSAWKFDFSYEPATTFFATSNLTLQPGESKDFLFGTFKPQNGPVAAGVYSFSSGGLSLGVYGLDLNGDTYPNGGKNFDLGSTCASYDASCAFTRTVVSVPEPGTYGLLAAGLCLIGWRLRRVGASLTRS